jgi:hypothetical protein
MRKFAVAVLVSGIVAALSMGPLAQTVQKLDPVVIPGLSAPVTVVQDKYGIPHVFAQNALDLYRVVGWLHARDRLWQMDKSPSHSQRHISRTARPASALPGRHPENPGHPTRRRAERKESHPGDPRRIRSIRRGRQRVHPEDQRDRPASPRIQRDRDHQSRPVDSARYIGDGETLDVRSLV